MRVPVAEGMKAAEINRPMFAGLSPAQQGTSIHVEKINIVNQDDGSKAGVRCPRSFSQEITLCSE